MSYSLGFYRFLDGEPAEPVRGHLPEGLESDAVFVPEITLEVFERVAGPFSPSLT
ncbi:hypothetical protein [Streptomyces mirabilis]|uniref:hypothetical protein n=1 Tax=Streptomyces mirabilis TaxID=68239 RepID=UPI002E1FD76B